MFDLPQSFLTWIFAGIALACILFTLLYLLRPLFRTGSVLSRRAQAAEESYTEYTNETPDNEEVSATPGENKATCPKVSVIVYSFLGEDSLSPYLESLSTQDYPDFEVIVVCETTSEYAGMLSETYSKMYPSVYVTFIPPGSHNLSRRKLALTLGMKAAKGEIVVTTVSNAIISSDRWLSLLVEPFLNDENCETGISLGYSHISHDDLHGIGKWYREFDTLLTDAQWIGYALNRQPYRGDGYNLAFRREIFFRHKGYAGSLYLHSGDDDLFINEIATPDNTEVSILPENIIVTEWGYLTNQVWGQRKEQYSFTSRWLPRAPFIRAGATSLMQWLIPAVCALTAIIELPNLAPACFAAFLLLVFWLVEILIYRKAAGVLNVTRLWWALPIFWLCRPIINECLRLTHRNLRNKNYTWQRH